MAAFTTIDNPELYFQTVLYTGDGSSHAITLGGDEDMSPSLVWIKERNSDISHRVFDSVRGATNRMFSNNDDAESSEAESLKSFDSDGFTLGTGGSINGSSDTYVAWCWKAGTTSSISGGAITPSAVSINTTSGFGIYAYAGVSGASSNIAHGLGVAPKFVIAKKRSAAGAWSVYHGSNTSAPATDYLWLNTDAATTDNDNRWYDTDPTSTLITVGDYETNESGSHTFVMYAFAPVQGFSKFGSFVSNGDDDGAFCYLGFRAAYILMKKQNASGTDWYIFYNKSPGYNENNKSVRANENHDEDQASGYPIDILSNGFKIRTDNTAIGEDGATFVYAAFAEQPFVNSNGVPCNAR